MSLAQYQLSYQYSPIMLVMGVSQSVPGGKIAAISLTQALNYSSIVAPAGTGNSLGGSLANSGAAASAPPFATFMVLAGGTLIDNDIAHWPLANQAVAANAVISKPLKISLVMLCPATVGVSLAQKQSILTALQSTIAQHIALGGWFDVATPAFVYTGCLLASLEDVTDYEDGGQVQLAYRWDFEQPLISQQQANVVYNVAMGKIGSGAQNTGDPPNSNPVTAAVGGASNIIQNISPATTALSAANAADLGASVGLAPSGGSTLLAGITVSPASKVTVQ